MLEKEEKRNGGDWGKIHRSCLGGSFHFQPASTPCAFRQENVPNGCAFAPLTKPLYSVAKSFVI